VLALNSGCWQAQTDFQKSVNIDPDSGYAPILDLDTLDMTVRKFSLRPFPAEPVRNSSEYWPVSATRGTDGRRRG